MVAAQRRAECRYAITDGADQLLLAGLTRSRPDGVRDGSVGGVVELQIPGRRVAELAARPELAPGWRGVIDDIAGQFAGWPQLRPGLDDRPDQRLPKAGLRRHTQVRDRGCRVPGCRRPATEVQYDHTWDYHLGGLTADANGGQVRGHDHDLKTKGGWRLCQPDDPGPTTLLTPGRPTGASRPVPAGHGIG